MSAVAAWIYENPIDSAEERANEFWVEALKRGPVAPSTSVENVLTREFGSVRRLYSVLLTMAFTGPTYFERPRAIGGREVQIVEKGGGRRWGQRPLAAAAHMAVNTARFAMKKLEELGLIVLEVSKFGTYIRVKGFQRYANPGSWRATVGSTAKKNPVSVPATFPSPTTVGRSLDSTVDGSESKVEEGASQKAEKISVSALRSDILAAIRRIQRRPNP